MVNLRIIRDKKMKQIGQIPQKFVFYIVGFLFACMAFKFVFDAGIDSGIPAMLAYTFAFLAFVVVLAFFIEQLRVLIRVIFRIPK